jgi:hypothetical protein
MTNLQEKCDKTGVSVLKSLFVALCATGTPAIRSSVIQNFKRADSTDNSAS